jgi:serine/threonine-protein kinase
VNDDSRIDKLLAELLETGSTPEHVCRPCPELLEQVRAGWLRLRFLDNQLGELFPDSARFHQTIPSGASPALDLPNVRGYTIEGVLGCGGMGVVYKARHLRLNRPVALKTIRAGAYARTDQLERFLREAEVVAGLRHANIVQVYEVGDTNGQPYFTMEFVEGGSLAAKLDGTPRSATEAASFLATVAEAIHVAHQSGIIHRDLKPSNILLTVDGTPKLSDFGLARRLEGSDGLTLTGAPIGTPSYMAPEQAAGVKAVIGSATDVYALGAILYELLCGRPPFRSDTAAATLQQVIRDELVPPARLNPRIPRDLDTICLQCLHKDPQRRYAAAAELAADLHRFQRGEPIRARRVSAIERAVKWTRRNRSLAASFVIAALLLVVLTAWGIRVAVDRTVLARTVEDDLRQAADDEHQQKWLEAQTAIERARVRLGGNGPADLRRRMDGLARELLLVAFLDKTRESRVDFDTMEKADARACAAYEKAFCDAGYATGQEDPEAVATRIRASGIAPVLLIALDDWALCDENRRNWLIDVARRVDPEPSSRRIRDPLLMKDLRAVEEFFRTAPLKKVSPPLLFSMKPQAQQIYGSEVPLLVRVRRAHPQDFWANFELALAMQLEKQNLAEVIGYYQAAIVLRPQVARAHCNLALALLEAGQRESALLEVREAARLEPDSAPDRHNLGIVLIELGRFDEAAKEFHRAIELDPDNAAWFASLGICLARQNKHREAVELYRKAIALDPTYFNAHYSLRAELIELGQMNDACKAWRRSLELDPSSPLYWDGYAELCLYLGDEVEYRRTRRELLARFGNTADPRVAEKAGRACLFLPASNDELRQAAALIDRALADNNESDRWLVPYFRFAKGLAEYRAGRLESALTYLSGPTQEILVPAPALTLAMVQHKLGKVKAARSTFDSAVAGVKWELTNSKNVDMWLYVILRREAEKVLGVTR